MSENIHASSNFLNSLTQYLNNITTRRLHKAIVQLVEIFEYRDVRNYIRTSYNRDNPITNLIKQYIHLMLLLNFNQFNNYDDLYLTILRDNVLSERLNSVIQVLENLQNESYPNTFDYEIIILFFNRLNDLIDNYIINRNINRDITSFNRSNFNRSNYRT